MLAVSIAPAADADIDSHILYGIETFGSEQAWSYQDKLYSMFDMLARFPGMGRLVASTLHPGCRIFGFGSHVIVYTVEPERITVRRVLHASVDIPRHL
jgi:toxin ParE1/3/4